MERGPLATVVVVTTEVGGEVGVVVDVAFDDEHAPTTKTTTAQQAMTASLLTEGACRRGQDARKAGTDTMVPATDS